MALKLELDVVRPGELSWNRSSVVVPAEFLDAVRSLAPGSVVEAKCKWAAGGLTLLARPRVITTAESWQERLEIAVDRGNWESVLELLAAQPASELNAAWKARALLGLGREREFQKAFARLVSSEQVDLSDSPTGLWRIRLDIKPDHWMRLPRKLRASAFKLAWGGLLGARQFGEQRFADTLMPELARLLEEVEPAARPANVHAGGPRLHESPEPDAFIACCAAQLAPFATAAERIELGPIFQLLARYDPEAKEPLRAVRRRPGSGGTLSNAIAEAVMAITNARPRPAIERTLQRMGLILAGAPKQLVTPFLSAVDQFALVHEARALLPEDSRSLHERITAVCYRGSVELRIGELDAIVGRAGEAWFALRKHENGWVCVEGSREDALAAIPDELFEEAVELVMGR